MRKSLYNSIIPAAMIALGSLGYNSANAQQVARDSTQAAKPSVQQTRTVQNRIDLIDDTLYPTSSACGEGVFLKDFVYKVELTPKSERNLRNFKAVKGDTRISSIDAKESIRDGIKYLEGKPRTGENIACRRYLEGLLRNTPESDRQSTNLLNKAVANKHIDVEKDSLYKNGTWQVKDGRYAFVIHSNTLTIGGIKYLANSLPILVDITTSSGTEQAASQINVDSLEKAVRDRVSKQVRDSLERDKFVSDSIKDADAERAKGRGRVVVHVKPYEARKSRGGEKLRTRYGVELGAGTNLSGENELEGIVGGFVETPFTRGISVEGYLNFHVYGGSPISFDTTSTETIRETELIGPGTYKSRTDSLSTFTEANLIPYIPEAGIRLLLKPQKNFGFLFGAGTVLTNPEKTVHGKSIIRFKRNQQQLGETDVTENTVECDKNDEVAKNIEECAENNVSNWSITAGLFYAPNNHWEFQALGNRTGERNSLRLNLKYKF